MRNAFLIIAHNEWEILKKNIQIIDDVENDIYLHIDAKCKDVDVKDITSQAIKSNIYIIDRMDVAWGGDSQIRCEMNLLKNAVRNKYDYYHLLSGVDLCIKTPQEMRCFLQENMGIEYISLDKSDNCMARVRYYHFFRNHIRRDKIGKDLIFRILYYLFYVTQKILHVDRTRSIKENYYKGANWFSITHKMVEYILSQEKFIKKYFKFTICGDEMFLQTVAMQSPYANNIYGKCLTYTDWVRGNPYTFCKSDYKELVGLNYFFARKFSTAVDSEIVDQLFYTVMSRKNGHSGNLEKV